MTEFVIIAPFLAIMMGATAYFRDMHIAKMNVARLARENAWGQAYNHSGNCTTRGAVDGALGNLADTLAPVLDYFSDAINIGNLFYYPTVRRTEQASVNGLTWLSGATVSSQQVVQCNEIDYGDGPHGLALGVLSAWWALQW